MRGRSIVFAALLPPAALGLAACVLKADGFSGGSSTLPEAAAPHSEEAAAPAEEEAAPFEAAAPAEDASTDAGLEAAAGLPPNLLTNGDFENGCAGWQPPDDASTITMTTSTEARTGAKACRVCMNANASTYIYQSITAPVTVGDVIGGEIWARGTQANPPLSNIAFALSYTPQGQNDIDSPYATAIPPSSQWIRMTIVQDIYVDAPVIGLFVQFDGNQNKCVILDDASFSIVQ